MIKKSVRTVSGIALLLLLLSVIVGGALGAPAHAINEGACNDELEVLGAVINVPVDTYDIYVKLAREGQVAQVQVTIPGDSATCNTIGQTVANGNEWTKLDGTIGSDGSDILFNLTSNDLDQGYEYDRPTLMLVSQTNPACVPTDECFVMVDGQSAALEPSTGDTDTGTLQIFYAQSIEGQTIKEVRYYVDGLYMYKTAQLEPFNQQSIPYYGRSTSRVIEFESGQTAVIEAAVPIGSSDGPMAMLMRSVVKYQSFLIWVGVIIGLVIIFHIVHHIIRAIAHRRYWLYAHGLIKEEPAEPITASKLYHIYQRDKIRRIAKGLGTIAFIGVLGIGIVLVLDTYVVRLISISGSSMEQSLHDGDRAVVDKVGVTFARINQTDFTPERGQVVASYLLSRFSTEADISDEDLMIKRVVGLPGERVVIEGNDITIYNSQSPEGFDPAEFAPWADQVIPEMDTKRLDIKLGTDEVFVIGDNRPVSVDSRSNGPVALRNIIGVIHEQ